LLKTYNKRTRIAKIDKNKITIDIDNYDKNKNDADENSNTLSAKLYSPAYACALGLFEHHEQYNQSLINKSVFDKLKNIFIK
jgi:hypothetical protein